MEAAVCIQHHLVALDTGGDKSLVKWVLHGVDTGRIPGDTEHANLVARNYRGNLEENTIFT